MSNPKQPAPTPWQRTLAILAIAQLLSALGFSMIFPFLPPFVTSLGSVWGLNPVFLAGAVFSVQGITMMVASPIWGAVADHVGRKPMVGRAMFGGAAIILLMGFARSAEELVLLRAVQGLVTGVVSAGNALVASVTPPERKGYAMGVLQTAMWSGVAVGPVVGGVLADHYGYRAAFVVTAVLLLIGGVLVQFGVRESFTPPTTRLRLGGMLGDWRHIVQTDGIGATFVARFTAWLGRGVLTPVLPLFVPLILVDGARVGTVTGLAIGIASATGTVSALVLGGVGDRLGHRRVIAWAAALAAVAYVPLAFVHSPLQLLVLNGIAGIAIGGIMPSLGALLAQFTEDTEVGSAFGLDNAVVAASRAVAPLLGVGVAAVLTPYVGQEAGYRAVFLTGAVLYAATLWVVASRMPARAAPRPAVGD